MRGLWRLIHSDLRRYRATGARSSARVVLLTQGFWASCTYRVCHALTLGARKSALRIPVAIVVALVQKAVQIVTGISLPPGCDVGPGLYIAHFGGIIVHPEARLGGNCNIGCQVVIGYGRSGGKWGYPILGDRVFVGPGAKILGPVTVGNDSAIGANAVVLKDVPDRAVVGGVPARVISQRGSFDYIFYDCMDEDPDRLRSLSAAAQAEQ